jgi:hypothetical protein
MTKVLFLSLTLCAGAFAQDNIVRWRGIEGVITAPGIDNPISAIHSGTGPWTTKSGSAVVDLTTGVGAFDVEGLVLNGGTASGTPGAVASVVGTLMCNPGNAGGISETVLDTQAVALSPNGNAELSFKLNVPPTCNNPVFLIRTTTGRWLATGTKPANSPRSN